MDFAARKGQKLREHEQAGAEGLRIWPPQKKDGTNVFCSCREASDATYFQLWSGKLYQLHHWNIYTIT
jgi:hypothetical protein